MDSSYSHSLLSVSSFSFRSPPPPRYSCGRILRSPPGNGIRCSAERQALFSRIAPFYDNLNDVLSLGQHRTWKRMSGSWSRSKRGDRVLDLCCGSGDLAFLLSQKVGPEGEGKKDIASYYNVTAWNNSWEPYDFSQFTDRYFDAITMGYGLRNLINKHKAMQEIFRVLKPGSRVSILDFNKSTSSLVTLFQEWMIDNVVVPVASTYDLSKEYKYLKASIAEFLTGRELEKLAREVGFSDAKHYEIGGGLMGNLVATRCAFHSNQQLETNGSKHQNYASIDPLRNIHNHVS